MYSIINILVNNKKDMSNLIKSLDEVLGTDCNSMLGENIKEKLERLVSAWNGEDDEFIFEWSIYTEADVQEAEEVLATLNK